MKLQHATFNRIIIALHIITYAVFVGFLWPYQALPSAVLSMSPSFLLLFLWRAKNPIIFLSLNISVVSVFSLIEVPQFELYFSNFLEQITSQLSYEQGMLFSKSYLLIVTFLIFYFPIVFFVSLINFAMSKNNLIAIKISLIGVLFFYVVQFAFFYVFSRDFREVLVVAGFQALTASIFLYGCFFKSGQTQLVIFDAYLHAEGRLSKSSKPHVSKP